MTDADRALRTRARRLGPEPERIRRTLTEHCGTFGGAIEYKGNRAPGAVCVPLKGRGRDGRDAAARVGNADLRGSLNQQADLLDEVASLMPTGHVEEDPLDPDNVAAAIAIAHRGIPA